MANLSNEEMLQKLTEFNTPAITNVVATYPGNPLCLGLYNPWVENWYTDGTVRAMYPNLKSKVGYAVTAVYGVADPNYKKLTLIDVMAAIEASPKPAVLVIQQKYPPEIAPKAAIAGGMMVTAMKAMGCVGMITNGVSRDVDEIREMDFQYILGGVASGHGDSGVYSINVPVSVASMDVSPGEIVHMDEHGACKFPADKLTEVSDKVAKMQQLEEDIMADMANASSAEELREMFARQKSYATRYDVKKK